MKWSLRIKYLFHKYVLRHCIWCNNTGVATHLFGKCTCPYCRGPKKAKA